MVPIALVAAFVVLNISALRAMRRAGTIVWPDRGTDHLVTEVPSPLPEHPRCKSSPSSGRKGIYKRDSGRAIWIMPVASGDGFNSPLSMDVLEALACIAESQDQRSVRHGLVTQRRRIDGAGSFACATAASGPEPPVGFSEQTSAFGRKPVRRHLVIQIGK
jgi:hypothetical protein